MAAVLSVALLLADDEEASVAAVAAVIAEAVALPDRGPAGECRVLMKRILGRVYMSSVFVNDLHK